MGEAGRLQRRGELGTAQRAIHGLALGHLPAVAGDTRILLGGAGPDGIAVLRFRPAIWSTGLECYLAELYVAPAERGRGLGRALMEAAIALARDAGADTMDLGTNETDTAARALYESLGFTQLEDGTPNFFYEREL